MLTKSDSTCKYTYFFNFKIKKKFDCAIVIWLYQCKIWTITTYKLSHVFVRSY